MSVLEAVGWGLVHFVWQGALVALVVAVALRSMRDASASARYALSAGALFAMMLLPAATAWRLAGADARPAIEALDIAPVVAVVEPRPALTPPVARTTLDRRSDHPQSADPAGREAGVDGIVTRAADGARSPSRGPARPPLDAWLPWLVAAWASGVLLLSARLFGGWLRAWRLSSRGVSPVPDACRATLARLAARLEVRRTVRLFESHCIDVPVAIGWLRPVVLLPTSAFSGLTVDQLDAILAHELAHIRRHDYAVNLAQSVIETVLFYHPAVWWVSRQVRQEREHCCDDLAVAVCGDREGYARALVGMERLRHPVPLLSVRANGGSLVMRVRRLLSPNIMHAEPAPRWVASVIALSTALTVGATAGVPAAITSGPSVAARATHVPAPAAPQPSMIVQNVDPTIPFGERWAAAQRDATTRGWPAYWLGYTVQPAAGLHGFIYSDRSATTTGHGMRFSGTFSGHVENMRFPGVSIAPLVGASDPGRIKLLFSFAGGTAPPTLSRTHASSFVLPVELEARPLIWLGHATAIESLPIVERLYASQANQKARGDLITALGLHDDSARVVPLLVKILTGGEAPAVRSDAAERLGWHPVPGSLAALERAARTDRAPEVRREAAETIGDLDLPDATPTLISLARTLDDREARQEAVEALGQRPEATAREALVALARTDRDVDVQREAVETLGELKDPQAVIALTDIARTHPTVDVRREAIETLGEAMPPVQAVVFLARVAREEAHADVQREAVETLGEIKHSGALPALVEIARTHPKPDVRREAIETIRDAMPADEAAALLGKVAREDGNVDVQREAVETLGELEGGRGIGEVARNALTHPVVDIRREAIETLAEHAPHATAVDVLSRIVSGDGDEDVRRQALEGLAQLSEGAGIPALIDVARSHPSRDLRAEALKRLVDSEDPRARAVFDRALAKP